LQILPPILRLSNPFLPHVSDAAEALAKWQPELSFDMNQPRSKQDQQMAAIKARLAH
jgi:hypothetical protein